jgi:uncharacterized protein YecT (DUF1311 family)
VADTAGASSFTYAAEVAPMSALRSILAACACVVATAAGAGALDECMTKGDHPAVTRCLVDADTVAQDGLAKAEAAAAKAARDLDAVTGRPGAAAAHARSKRAFAEYRRAQCDLVRAMYASGTGADQGALACRIDATRQRVRDLQP